MTKISRIILDYHVCWNVRKCRDGGGSSNKTVVFGVVEPVAVVDPAGVVVVVAAPGPATIGEAVAVD